QLQSHVTRVHVVALTVTSLPAEVAPGHQGLSQRMEIQRHPYRVVGGGKVHVAGSFPAVVWSVLRPSVPDGLVAADRRRSRGDGDRGDRRRGRGRGNRGLEWA